MVAGGGRPGAARGGVRGHRVRSGDGGIRHRAGAAAPPRARCRELDHHGAVKRRGRDPPAAAPLLP